MFSILSRHLICFDVAFFNGFFDPKNINLEVSHLLLVRLYHISRYFLKMSKFIFYDGGHFEFERHSHKAASYAGELSRMINNIIRITENAKSESRVGGAGTPTGARGLQHIGVEISFYAVYSVSALSV